MSGCSRFKQNAWKKELCSNCYRPKEEHKSKKPQRELIITIPLKAATQGILSLGNKHKKKKKCVRFLKEESEVIGYGGVEASDSEDDEFEFERSEQPVPFEREVVGEEEKALEQLTKNNTDFNSVLKNLNTVSVPPQTSSAAQPSPKPKNTVPPSPQQCSSISIAASRKTHLTKLLEEENVAAVPAKSPVGEPEHSEKEKSAPIANNVPIEPLEKPVETPIKSVENPLPSKATEITAGPKNADAKTNTSGSSSSKQSKKEERGAPEGRKSLIQRGSIVTKIHEQVKNKLYIQKSEKRNSVEGDSDKENVKIIITNLSAEEKIVASPEELINEKSVQPLEGPTEPEKVTVKVMKLLNGEDGPPESREMAGEPDGKADSDEHEQETSVVPPPRSSFLHRETVSSPDQKIAKSPTAYPLIKDHNSVYQTPITLPKVPLKQDVDSAITEVKCSVPNVMSYQASTPDAITPIEKSKDVNSTPVEANLTSPTVNSFEVKIAKPAPIFTALSPEFKSFKSSLPSISNDAKIYKGAPTLPPTPLTLAKSSPSSILPVSPTSITSFPSSNSSINSPKSSSSSPKLTTASQPDSSSLSSYSSLERQPTNALPPLPTTPPPQPSRFPAPFFPNGHNSASLPILGPLQINTLVTHSPTEDVQIFQEVCIRKRPAPKPPVETPPEPFPRRRNSLEITPASQEKKKTRMRHTLRKLLRFGSKETESPKVEEEPPVVPRPRPQIIHPLDLNKSGVQVLPPHSMERSVSMDSSSSSPSPIYGNTSRPNKPPPPPRSESLNLMERLRPLESTPGSCDNVYANLGEGRCGITPVKPQRTGSMREAPLLSMASIQQDSTGKTMSYQSDSEHVYECVGVGTFQDELSRPQSRQTLKRSPSCADDAEIYYPYVTFLNGECKTLMKKRGTITQTLEENYGALVIANSEALTHLLQKILDKKPKIPIEIQSLPHVKWDTFEIQDGTTRTVVDGVHSVDATIGQTEVTLLVTKDHVVPKDLETWATFSDSPSAQFLGEQNTLDNVSVAVLKRCKIEQFLRYVQNLEKSVDSVREGVMLLLQTVKFMIHHKTKMVDPNNFFVFSFVSQPPNNVACYLQPSGDEETSCLEAVRQLCSELLGDLALGKILNKCDLEEIPSVLEVWLWGPASLLSQQAIDRWLDLERANLLQALVKKPTSAVQELHRLSFLVHTTGTAVASANDIIHPQVPEPS